MNTSRRGSSLFFATFAAVCMLHAAPDAAQVWEAEQMAAPGARRFADAQASGKSCVGVVFGDIGSGSGELFARTQSLPAGLYEVTFLVDAFPVEVMHQLGLTLHAGGDAVTLHTVHFEGRGGYRPVTLRVRHAGGPFSVSGSASSSSGFNGMRAGQGEDEKALIQSAPLTGAKPDDGAAEWLAELDAIAGEQDVRDRALPGHRVWCDKVTITRLAAYVLPLDVRVDKVHYRPGEMVQAAFALKPADDAPPPPWALAAELVSELDRVETVWTGTSEAREGAFTFTLPQGREFGRELRLRVTDGAKATLGEAVTLFGVSSNVYTVGITGRGGAHNMRDYPMEKARAEMQANRSQYANYFEKFAWAPCDYSDLDPQEEFFFSGQTQYPGSVQSFKNLLAAAHEVGIKGITYGKACAGGIAGFNTLQRHPEFFGHSRHGFVAEAFNVFFLERMLANGYNFGKAEEGGWQHWASLWTDYTNTNTVLFGAEAIIASIKRFGWDGVRWDGHFVDYQKAFLDRLREVAPDFVHGYNIAFADPGADRFMPPDQTDFHEVAAGGGLMMDESARDWSNTNFSPGWHDRFYVAMCREADYIKAVDGLPLIITFDMASRQDLHLNVLMALAAGQRYTYLTSPGDYAYGPLPKWLTRFSAFVWDKTRRFEEESVTVTTADDQPLWWKESVWLRRTGPETWQVLTSIINPPLYKQFCNRVQPPPVTATNATAAFRPPAGATVTRAFYLSPELADGWRPLTAALRDGASVVSLPPLHVFGIAGFEFTWSGAGTPFRLRDPVGEVAAIFATQAEETARKAAEAKAKASIGAPVEKPVEPAPRADDAFAAKNPPPPGWRLERDGALDVLHARGPFS